MLLFVFVSSDLPVLFLWNDYTISFQKEKALRRWTVPLVHCHIIYKFDNCYSDRC